jgi:hypothetical protein
MLSELLFHSQGFSLVLVPFHSLAELRRNWRGSALLIDLSSALHGPLCERR